MSPLKVVDLSMEQGEVYLKWLEDESSSENFLILCYVLNNSLDSGKNCIRAKNKPRKNTQPLNSIFQRSSVFQDIVIDSTIAMLEKIKNQKKAS